MRTAHIGLLIAAAAAIAGCGPGVREHLSETQLATLRVNMISDYGGITTAHGGTRQNIHKGLDLVGRGDVVMAAADGVVKHSHHVNLGGNLITIDHGQDADGSFIATAYAHNEVNLVKPGDKVKRGDVIARMGSTGPTTTHHSHFEVVRHPTVEWVTKGWKISNPHEFWHESLCFDPDTKYEARPIKLTLPVRCK